MEFKKEKEEMNFIEEQLSGEPCINVIGKDEFEERVYKVFNILWEKLSRSFGPGGAGTFISLYPNYYNTKDGFTIMKNIAFDKKLDQVISDMVMTICNRLNFTVGDGTTTAVIATKSTYDGYLNNKDFFKDEKILPRNILSIYENFKNILLEKIDNAAKPIRSDDPKELRKNIEKVVYISSNANDEITNMIGSLYEELMFPAISCTLSKDGAMHHSIISGYKLDVSLTDKIYINNDNNTMSLTNADIIMFDHKVGKDTYEHILRPLANDCEARGRHLVCIAPFYDETALGGIIRTDLNNQYKKNKDINLVLTVCTKATGHSKVLLNDLAMLLNTELITPSMEDEYISKIKAGTPLFNIFDLDNRYIPDINVATVITESENQSEIGKLRLQRYSENTKNIFGESWKDNCMRVGYCDELDVGLKESTFSGFYYDKEVYKKYLNNAKEELAEVQKKCEKIGTFSMELTQKQQRYYSLGLKTGLIEVGSTSELSQGYLKDTVDDAIKAAASAFNNGVVLGCNVSLSSAILDLLKGEESIDMSEVESKLLFILLEGYLSVYKTVLSNVVSNTQFDFGNMQSIDDKVVMIETAMRELSPFKNFRFDVQKFREVFLSKTTLPKDLHSIIIFYSICTDTVFDLSDGTFNTDVINSAETDKEILKATIDLLSLLITGNQIVLC